jgi:hypothetical protein
MRYGRRSRYPGNGPFKDLPPYQRPGYIYGRGGRGFWGKDPTHCAKFPWLPKWWWANPDQDAPFPHDSLPETEKEFLENQISYLKNELDLINKRLEKIRRTESKENS